MSPSSSSRTSKAKQEEIGVVATEMNGPGDGSSEPLHSRGTGRDRFGLEQDDVAIHLRLNGAAICGFVCGETTANGQPPFPGMQRNTAPSCVVATCRRGAADLREKAPEKAGARRGQVGLARQRPLEGPLREPHHGFASGFGGVHHTRPDRVRGVGPLPSPCVF